MREVGLVKSSTFCRSIYCDYSDS